MAVFSNIGRERSVGGLEVIFSGEGKMELNGIVLKAVKGKLLPGLSKQGMHSVEEARNLFKGMPVVLSLNGKGIIHKKVSWNESDTAATGLQKVLTNASLNDFYVQYTQAFNGMAYVSVMRKTLFDPLAEELAKQKIELVDCLLGPFAMEGVLPLLETGGEYQFDLHVMGYKLSVVDQVITDVVFGEARSGTEQVPVGGEPVKEGLLIAFASAFSRFAGSKVTRHSIERVQIQAREYADKKRFQLVAWGLIAFFMLLAGLNMLASRHYRLQRDNWQTQVNMNADAVSEYDTLNKAFSEKRAFFEKKGLLQPSRLSYYANDIARDMPEMIRLEEMTINPLEKKHQDEIAVDFISRQIVIAGNCVQSIELNDWMRSLKKKEWVKEVTLMNYSQDKGNSNGEFTLSLTLK